MNLIYIQLTKTIQITPRCRGNKITTFGTIYDHKLGTHIRYFRFFHCSPGNF